jgi:Family of unknown function (DUF6364)
MVVCMKTTLNIDDGLLRKAKRTAAERGVTLTSIVEDALRSALGKRSHPPGDGLEWPTVKGRRPPDVDISDRESLYEWMEGRR